MSFERNHAADAEVKVGRKQPEPDSGCSEFSSFSLCSASAYMRKFCELQPERCMRVGFPKSLSAATKLKARVSGTFTTPFKEIFYILLMSSS